MLPMHPGGEPDRLRGNDHFVFKAGSPSILLETAGRSQVAVAIVTWAYFEPVSKLNKLVSGKFPSVGMI